MYDFGDDFTIESHRITWLIWIQLLVMCLLLLLLYCCSISASNLSSGATASAAAFPSSSSSRQPKSYESHMNKPQLLIPTCSRDANQVREDQIIIEETEARTDREAGRRGDSQEEEDSSTKDATHVTLLGFSHHPCHFLGIAKQIFLKCFGLDYTSRPFNNNKEN